MEFNKSLEAYRQKPPTLTSQSISSQRKYPPSQSDHQSVSMFSAYSDPRLARTAMAPDPRRKEVKPASPYLSYSYGVPSQSQRTVPMTHMYDDRDDRRNLRYYAPPPSNPREDPTRKVYSNGHVNLVGEQATEVLRRPTPYRQGK